VIAAVVIWARYQSRTAYQGILATLGILESPNRPAAMRVSFTQYKGSSLDVSVADEGWDPSSEEGFERFYRDTYPWIARRVRARFPRADEETVHDAISDAYLNCRPHLSGLRSADPRAQRRYVLTAAEKNAFRLIKKNGGVAFAWDSLADMDVSVGGSRAPCR
jgi:hypothetical protein